MSLLVRSSLRYLSAHRWQFGLSILGVALGVAVVVSVDLANSSAARAFEISRDTVTGRATHQVVGGPDGVPEESFVRLRREVGIRRVAPIVEGYVSLPDPSADNGFVARRPLRLLGVDPFSEAPFRAGLGTGPLDLDLRPFLTRRGAVLMSAGTAESLAVAVGDQLEVRIGPRRAVLQVAGVLALDDPRDAEAAADLLVADIATAQEVLDLGRRLTRIDLIIDDTQRGLDLLDRVRAELPGSVQLVTAAARTETTRQLTRAFRVNLTALSLLALVCGVFLVYNTMSFSVVQRRQMIGTMRAIGVTRGEVFRLLLTEAAAVGIAGTLLGLLGGIGIGRWLVALVTRTINDLYFVLSVRDLALDPISLAKGAGLGILGAIAATIPAALEATGAPPGVVMLRSQVEARARARALPVALIGAALLVAGGALLAFSGRDLVLSFAAMFMVIVGFAMLTPAVVVALMHVATVPMGWLLGPLGRIATRGVSASLSRTAVAIAALMIAVSVAVGVGVMIDSFRSTVTRWLDTILVADLYVAPLAPGATPVGLELDAPTRTRLEAIAGVVDLDTIRGVEVPQPDGGRTRLLALEIDARARRGYRFVDRAPEAVWADFERGDAVIVTEPYAYRRDLAAGDRIELVTASGPRPFEIAGVYYNYASEEGLVGIDRRTYERYWDDRDVSGFSLYLEAGTDVDMIARRIRAILGDREVTIQPNRALRELSLEVFDRTFLITGVLRLLVTLVAVIGVLSALMSLQLERAHEVGTLRALGLTPGEVWRLSTAQSGLMGFVSGIMAVPVGLVLAAIMIFVINRRSFGWSLQMQAAPEILLQAFALALVASLAAGLYPALRMARMRTAVALREE